MGKAKKWLLKTGACLIQVNLHLYGLLLDLKKWPLNTGDCLIQVAFKTGLTVVNFHFLDGDVPRPTSYGVYISQLIRFARASSNLNDFNYRNKALTAKLLRQGDRYIKLRKAFSKFYRRHSALLEKYSVSLKTLLQQGISEPEFHGD